MEDEATEATDHTVVVSLTIKSVNRSCAKADAVKRLNEWFNDPDTMVGGARSEDTMYNGALLHYSILNPSYTAIIVDGVEYVAKV